MIINGQNTETLYVTCPHCYAAIEIQPFELRCGIFRHAAYKTTLQPIDPHASREVCDLLVKHGLVYGCARPFHLVEDPSGTVHCLMCDYV